MIDRYFSVLGRIPRTVWLARFIVLSVVALAFGLLARGIGGSVGAALMAAVYLWSAVALASQRLHDTGRTAWALLWALMPVAGPLMVLFWLLNAGVEGCNQYGSDPGSRRDYLRVDIAR